jgi:hypothetical protein
MAWYIQVQTMGYTYNLLIPYSNERYFIQHLWCQHSAQFFIYDKVRKEETEDDKEKKNPFLMNVQIYSSHFSLEKNVK